MPDAPMTAVRVGPSAAGVLVHTPDDVPAALAVLDLGHRPVIVVVGGADDVGDGVLEQLRPLVDEALLPVAAELGAAVVDGGTRSGVMRVLGESRARSAPGVLLLGVAVARTVRLPGLAGSIPDAADLEPHHSHFVLVPGDRWGEESPWLAQVAGAVAGGFPSVTVVLNGGGITVDDVANSVAASRQVIVVGGSGRTADDLAAAVDGEVSTPRLRALATSGLVTVVPVASSEALARALRTALSTR
ncbi:MAG: hypothetical protein ACXV0U_10820 [Kineosporiaceae bacterium]